MSYQKKSKSPFIYILLLIFTPLLILSFTSQKFSKRQKKSNQVISGSLVSEPNGLTNLQCVRMGKDTVDRYMHGGPDRKRIILELSTNEITTPNPKFFVFSYLAKKHSQHGIGVTPDTLKLIGNCVPLTFKADSNYIIGNNYVTLKKLKSFLADENYTYLKFTPIVMADRHIRFRFSAWLVKDGTEVNIKSNKVFFAGEDLTNPSPPADPRQ